MASAAPPSAVPVVTSPTAAPSPAAASPPAAAPPQQRLQQQQQQRPAAQQQAAPVRPQPQPHRQQASALDAVIDDVLGGDLGMEQRQLAADEMAYNLFCKVREAAGDQMDAETAAQLNELVAMTQAEKDAVLERSNRVARKVLRPLGYKMLQVQGLDPASVSPAAARAALQAELDSEQQAEVDAEAGRLFNEVYLPEVEAAAADVGLMDPDEVWQQFGQNILARQPEEPHQQSTAAIAVPAALAGAAVALVVSKVVGWVQRRRQRRRQGEESGSYEVYEEEGEVDEGEEVLTGSDQEAASAYDE